MHGEVEWFIHQFAATDMCISQQDLPAESKGVCVECRWLPVKQVSFFIIKRYGIGMAILFRSQPEELPGDPYIFITLSMQVPVDLLLANKLVHPVIRIILADQQSSFDEMRHRGHAAGSAGTVRSTWMA